MPDPVTSKHPAPGQKVGACITPRLNIYFNSQLIMTSRGNILVLRNLPTSPETPSKRQRTPSPTYPTNTNKPASTTSRPCTKPGDTEANRSSKEKKEETRQIFSHVLQLAPGTVDLGRAVDGRVGNKNKQPIFSFLKKKNHKNTKPQRTKRRIKSRNPRRPHPPSPY